MTRIRTLLAIGLLMLAFLAPAPSFAADATFPPGVRVGLVPIAGLAPATNFIGFVSGDQKVKVGLAELPETAFSSVDAAVRDNKIQPGAPKPQPFAAGARQAYFLSETGKDGDTPVQAYSLLVPGDKFTGYVIVQVRGDAGSAYSEDAIKKMLATTVTRPEVPVSEQLAQLAFNVTDLAGFKTVKTIAPRSAVLLTDGSEDSTLGSTPYILIGLMQGGPAQPEDRGRFARDVASSIPGLRESKLTGNEPLRIDGTPGYETRIEGTTGKDNKPVKVIQWLRFGNGQATLRIIASAPKDEWESAYPRFRAVRDGISPK